MLESDSLFEVQNAGREFDNGSVVALNGVSLEINAGDYLAIMGPSGSGKSTLLNLLGGLDHPTSGAVQFRGTPINKLPSLDAFRAKEIGFVFQSFHLVPNLTCVENVQLPMFELDWTAAARLKRAAELIETVGMSHRLKTLPAKLSVGERQRVAIARALANDAHVILADEPTGNLDSVSGAGVLDLFQQLNYEYEKTIIIITHSSEVAERAKRLIRMRDGRVESDQAMSAK